MCAPFKTAREAPSNVSPASNAEAISSYQASELPIFRNKTAPGCADSVAHYAKAYLASLLPFYSIGQSPQFFYLNLYNISGL